MDFLSSGVEHLLVAQKLEHKNDFDGAFTEHVKCIENLLTGLRLHKSSTSSRGGPASKASPKQIEEIRRLLKEEFARAEELKSYLHPNATAPASAKRNATASSSNRVPVSGPKRPPASANSHAASPPNGQRNCCSNGSPVTPSGSASSPSLGSTSKDENPSPKPDTEDKTESTADANLRRAVSEAILSEKPSLTWDDVAGLDEAKSALEEAVVLPNKFPQLFTGKRKAWGAILLFGPPGTGKSFLAKVVAATTASTFFSVSSSTLVSRWLGDSEKMIRELFSLAVERKPSVVFIDEIDSICTARSEGEHESMRRVKTEFMIQMDKALANPGVLVLGATNRPFDLDLAVLRRFQKRILVPLPDSRAREKLLSLSLGEDSASLPDGYLRTLADRLDGFSGADINILVRDVLLQPVREAMRATHFLAVSKSPSRPNHSPITLSSSPIPIPSPSPDSTPKSPSSAPPPPTGSTAASPITEIPDTLYTPCSAETPNAACTSIWDLPKNSLLLTPVQPSHFDATLTKLRPSVSPAEVETFLHWRDQNTPRQPRPLTGKDDAEVAECSVTTEQDNV
ncbi:Vacuolar protein sorting-associated protein 4 [Pelomyxa schiedti]|nr:Vacuolar protein sorting-associated protein 4 [Pelomyxa schiedti]